MNSSFDPESTKNHRHRMRQSTVRPIYTLCPRLFEHLLGHSSDLTHEITIKLIVFRLPSTASHLFLVIIFKMSIEFTKPELRNDTRFVDVELLHLRPLALFLFLDLLQDADLRLNECAVVGGGGMPTFFTLLGQGFPP